MKQEDIRHLVWSKDCGIRIGDTLYLLKRDTIHGKQYHCIECGKVLNYCRIHPSSTDVGDYYKVTVKISDGFDIYIDLDETRVLFASKSEDEVRKMLLK